MKKGLLTLAGIVAFGGLAGATTTSLQTCSSAGGVNGATSFSLTTLTCNGFNSLPLGDTLTGVTLFLSDSFNQGVPFQSNVFDFTYTSLDPDITLKNGAAPNTCITSGTGSSTGCLDVVSGAATNGVSGSDAFQLGNEITTNLAAYLGAGTFTVGSVTGSIDPSAPGSALNATGSIGATAFVTFTYSTPSTGSPEPGSMILIGGGLLAAGVIGRKKLVRR